LNPIHPKDGFNGSSRAGNTKLPLSRHIHQNMYRSRPLQVISKLDQYEIYGGWIRAQVTEVMDEFGYRRNHSDNMSRISRSLASTEDLLQNQNSLIKDSVSLKSESAACGGRAAS
jgi:hypothetical protein